MSDLIVTIMVVREVEGEKACEAVKLLDGEAAFLLVAFSKTPGRLPEPW